ncbi:hypothetical protein DFA_11350 [Cavenderia fasciculata]|uniref:Transmembrane protein n=1 Tax=Cavenderia fasciculata TaxID=261658 RepID=F4QCF4_CACFS|nr:uncharacterized protein DFA_11350 [Cavenderia fasciculata]EGG13589.1 hypothetical protein DFA_11350 [Cavenderia fasciculata]|eukprot:XP_004350293.1 hypothetical protein DFA_11350 [Cavenderia fasciculata]
MEMAAEQHNDAAIARRPTKEEKLKKRVEMSTRFGIITGSLVSLPVSWVVCLMLPRGAKIKSKLIVYSVTATASASFFGYALNTAAYGMEEVRKMHNMVDDIDRY